MTRSTDPHTRDDHQDHGAPAKDASADEIVADIEQTREQLGQTVDALTQKLDVSSRARDKMGDVKDLAAVRVDAARSQGARLVAQARDVATDENGRTRPTVPAGAAVVGAAAVALLLLAWSRRR